MAKGGAQQWYQVTDVAGFLSSKGQKRVGTHSMTKPVLHWRYCAHCGLMNLKNDVTKRALRQPCVTYE